MALAIISPIPNVGRWRRIGFIAANQSVACQSVPWPANGLDLATWSFPSPSEPRP